MSRSETYDKDEEDPAVPRAVLNKILKENLPSIRVASETRELISNCCSEFIHHISKESYRICLELNKKTITPQHVISALDNLNFKSYIPEALNALEEFKEKDKSRKQKKLDFRDVPEEELLRQQEELFAKARMEQISVQQNNAFHPQLQLSPYQDNHQTVSLDEHMINSSNPSEVSTKANPPHILSYIENQNDKNIENLPIFTSNLTIPTTINSLNMFKPCNEKNSDSSDYD